MQPWKRIIRQRVESSGARELTLDCGHRRFGAGRKGFAQCHECPPIPNEARPPLRKIASRGTDNKEGAFETLSCGHPFFPSPRDGKKAKSRRCQHCFDEGRTEGEQ